MSSLSKDRGRQLKKLKPPPPATSTKTGMGTTTTKGDCTQLSSRTNTDSTAKEDKRTSLLLRPDSDKRNWIGRWPRHSTPKSKGRRKTGGVEQVSFENRKLPDSTALLEWDMGWDAQEEPPDTETIGSQRAVCMWMYDSKDVQNFTVECTQVVYMVGEMYAFDKMEARTGQEEVYDTPNGRIKYRTRLALVKKAAVRPDNRRLGYMPRAYLCPELVWRKFAQLKPWYVGVQTVEAVKDRLMKTVGGVGMGTLLISQVPDHTVFDLPVYHMWVVVPILDALKTTRHALIGELIVRDPFGRYILLFMPRTPYSSLSALVMKVCGLHYSWEVMNRHMDEAPFGFWLRGGPRFDEKAYFEYPPSPTLQPDINVGGTIAGKDLFRSGVRADRQPFIPDKDLTIHEEIGAGNQATVYMATLLGKDKQKKTVAVKQTIGADDDTSVRLKSALSIRTADEVAMLGKINHKNVVQLLGFSCAVSEYGGYDNLCVVMDLFSLGSLNDYKKTGKQLTREQNIMVISQLAEGMAELERNHIIHRDVALRNVLLASVDPLLVKIADFGMAVQMREAKTFRDHTTKSLPWLWLAPETLEYRVFTHASDVWAYGIAVWELFTRGQPYGMGRSNKEANEFVLLGERPSKVGVPPVVYNVLETGCWQPEPSRRLPFSHLAKVGQRLLRQLQGPNYKERNWTPPTSEPNDRNTPSVNSGLGLSDLMTLESTAQATQ